MKVNITHISILLLLSSTIYSTHFKTLAKLKSHKFEKSLKSNCTETVKHLLKKLKTGPYECESELGEGRFGKIYKIYKGNGKTPKDAREYFAFKIIDHLEQKQINVGKDERPKGEITLLNELKGNQYITELKDWTSDATKSKAGMVLELMDSDLIRCFIDKHCHADIVTKNKVHLVKTLLEGLLSIHQKDIAHLDIKLENIMIKDSKPKYGDFGFALKIKSDEIANCSYGTREYIDLNVFEEVNPTNHGLGLRSDLYSLGIIILQIVDIGVFHCFYYDNCSPELKVYRKDSKHDPTYDTFKYACKLNEVQAEIEEDDFLNCLVVKTMLIDYEKRPDIKRLLELIESYENTKQYKAAHQTSNHTDDVHNHYDFFSESDEPQPVNQNNESGEFSKKFKEFIKEIESKNLEPAKLKRIEVKSSKSKTIESIRKFISEVKDRKITSRPPEIGKNMDKIKKINEKGLKHITKKIKQLVGITKGINPTKKK